MSVIGLFLDHPFEIYLDCMWEYQHRPKHTFASSPYRVSVLYNDLQSHVFQTQAAAEVFETSLHHNGSNILDDFFSNIFPVNGATQYFLTWENIWTELFTCACES